MANRAKDQSMNLFPDTGKPPIDLSNITFEKDYRIPASGTIASSYQKGFELSPEMQAAWRGGQGGEIASEFILHYYRAQGYGNAVEVSRIRDHDDCIGGFLVIVAAQGEYVDTYAIWRSSNKILIEEDRRERSVWS